MTGVSRYEATAYARLVGKRLPTSLHWQVATGSADGGCLITGSNFSGKLAPVGAYAGGLNSHSLFGMTCNARDSCANEAGNRPVTRGGACIGPAYLSRDVEARPPVERDPTTGFRCMVPLEPRIAGATLEETRYRSPAGAGA